MLHSTAAACGLNCRIQNELVPLLQQLEHKKTICVCVPYCTIQILRLRSPCNSKESTYVNDYFPVGIFIAAKRSFCSVWGPDQKHLFLKGSKWLYPSLHTTYTYRPFLWSKSHKNSLCYTTLLHLLSIW